METIAYCIFIVIESKVEYEFLIKDFLLNKDVKQNLIKGSVSKSDDVMKFKTILTAIRMTSSFY